MQYQIINEEELKNLQAYDRDTLINEYKFYPKHVYITDSFNNPFYPYSEIVYDKYTFDLPKYKRYLEKNIFGYTLEFLPFHFWIEFIEDDYYIFNTRPLYLKAVVTDDKYLDIRDNSYIVMICGNTKLDIHPKDFQIKLGKLLNSLYRLLVKIHNTVDKNKFIIPGNIDIYRIMNDETYRKIFTT